LAGQQTPTVIPDGSSVIRSPTRQHLEGFLLPPGLRAKRVGDPTGSILKSTEVSHIVRISMRYLVLQSCYKILACHTHTVQSKAFRGSLHRFMQVRFGGVLEQHGHLRDISVLHNLLLILEEELTARVPSPAQKCDGNENCEEDEGYWRGRSVSANSDQETSLTGKAKDQDSGCSRSTQS
jgi:hypothetical protein